MIKLLTGYGEDDMTSKSMQLEVMVYCAIFGFVFSMKGYCVGMEISPKNAINLSTPQSSFTYISKANNSGDWNTFVMLHSSNTRNYVIFRTIYLNGMSPQKEQDAFYNAMDKWMNGLEKCLSDKKIILNHTEESMQLFMDSLSAWSDRDSFLVDIYKYKSRLPRPFYRPKLKSVVIDGNRALGVVSFYTDHGVLGSLESTEPKETVNAGQFTVYFIKKGDSWFLSCYKEWFDNKKAAEKK